MASAGHAHAHSSQPTHFSSPSGHRLSWWRPWKRGAVGFFTSGYWTVSLFMNIWWNETPNPLTGFRKSVRPTRDLLGRRRGRGGLPVIVRRVHRRHREPAGGVARGTTGGPARPGLPL